MLASEKCSQFSAEIIKRRRCLDWKKDEWTTGDNEKIRSEEGGENKILSLMGIGGSNLFVLVIRWIQTRNRRK